MTVETELKLHISPEQLEKLKRHPFLATHSAGRARTHKLYSIYYDTPDLKLRQHAMALRVRRAGKQWIQTLKGAGQMSAGLHQRNEWESPVASEQLDFDALKACGGRLPRGVQGRLRPVFITDFSRNLRLIELEGAKIELCMDSGEVRAGQASCPISELELELKSGEPRQLFKLALALLDIVPLTVENTNKAEYGYLLFSGTKPSAAKARIPSLKKSQSISSALQNLIGACLTHVQSNVQGALLKLDEEYLHQVRVGLRRLRVVLAIAVRHHADPELAALRKQVTELCVELGRSRDWDVFVTQTLAPICARFPEHAGLREVLKQSEEMRAKQHAGMESSLASRDFQRMLLRFGVWMHGSHADDSMSSLEQFAVEVLEKRRKQVLKHGKKSAGDDAAQLHLLRIACKKLRYAVEMFGSLFNGNKTHTHSYVPALTELQDVLGKLNDIAVAHRLLDDLDTAARSDTVALIRDWMEHDRSDRIVALHKAWKKFAAQGRFWD